MEQKQYLMKFGKHKGRDIREVPRQYLQWLAREADLDTVMAVAVADVLKGRDPTVWYGQRPKWRPGTGESYTLGGTDARVTVTRIVPGTKKTVVYDK